MAGADCESAFKTSREDDRILCREPFLDGQKTGREARCRFHDSTARDRPSREGGYRHAHCGSKAKPCVLRPGHPRNSGGTRAKRIAAIIASYGEAIGRLKRSKRVP